MWLWVLMFSLAGSIGAVVGAALILFLPGGIRRRLTPILVSYATGTLLGAAFFGMLPAALKAAAATSVSATVLAGIVLFFLLEKLTLWHHCHDAKCEVHGQAGPLLLIGDGFHNFVDGVVIAAAFVTSRELGVATALAVAAHEVPQEVGDFAILLDNGYKRNKALLWNTLSAATTIPGALVGYFWLSGISGSVPYILALSAASFMYVAIADLIPQLHRESTPLGSLSQLTLLVVGITTIAILHSGL